MPRCIKIDIYQGQVSSPAPTNSTLLGQAYSRVPAPLPLKLDRRAEADLSPLSWNSEDSQDRLVRSPSPSRTVTQDSPPYSSPRRGLFHSQTMPMPRRSPIPRIVTPVDRTGFDSQKAMSGRGKAPPSSFPTSFAQAPPPSEHNAAADVSREAGKAGLLSQEHSSFEIDPDLAANADLAIQYEKFKPTTAKPPIPNKVMTPAQFELYREQQERDRRYYGGGGDSDSDGENDQDEYEDEVERDRQAAKQRRKQEAQLAVYRQTMMKVTGDQPGSRPTSGLSGFILRPTLDPKDSGPSSKESADEEEDEDVPLGILAAHGFPNKNRPPTRLSKSPSNSQPGPAASAAAETAARGSLPVFARNLPQDPYIGAGLVNPSNREPLAMGGGTSVYGAPAGAVPGPYPVHPAGLVGVIAGEERARAMRRGSPNAQGNYDAPRAPSQLGMSRSQTMGNLQHHGMMPPSVLSAGEQAQIQMSQTMSQMMLMQMQWMQQMQQMVHMQGSPPPPHMPQDVLVPPAPVQRPLSMPMPNMLGQRSMSTLSSSMAPWNRSSSYISPLNGMGGGPGYAPSMAPSERNNVGLASRYRPVSMVQDGGSLAGSHQRSSTFTASTVRAWTSFDSGRRSPTGATIRTLNPPAKKTATVVDDDDDDEGWAEMKAKKDKKQRGWRLRKAQTQGPGLRDLVPSEL